MLVTCRAYYDPGGSMDDRSGIGAKHNGTVTSGEGRSGPRNHQLHVWLDGSDVGALKMLESYFRESGSVVVRRLIRAAAAKVATVGPRVS